MNQASKPCEAFARPPDVDPDAVLRVFRVPPEAAGMRLDVFLHSQLRNTSRTRARAIVEKSAFASDGRRLRASERLRAEERVLLWRPPFSEPPAPSELDIIYEDEHLLVVNKPAPMTVHPTARHHHHTVLKTLERQRPDEVVRLIHRLDRETSGALLLARSEAADRAFKCLLEARSNGYLKRGYDNADPTSPNFKKSYLALCQKNPGSCSIDSPVAPDTDNPLRVKMRIAAPGEGLSARTAVEPLAERKGVTLVRCTLFTGRQHQIRLHLASVGCPIMGDKLYGPDERLLARAADNQLTEDDLHALVLPRQALHAERYRLPHAVTGQALDLYAPLARDLQDYWDSLLQP